MSYNKVLIALAVFIAVTVAMPYFHIPKDQGAANFELEYETNNRMWGKGPLKFRAQPQLDEWNRPMEQNVAGSDNDIESEYESPEYESPEYEEPGDIAAAEAAAGGTTSAEQTGAAGAAIGAAGAGVNSGTAADAGFGMAGAGAPVVDSPAGTGGHSHVYAAGGPSQLKATGSGTGSGVGIAIGISLLVVATACIAAFAIRHYWRHRL